jgi:hypothetical protein
MAARKNTIRDTSTTGRATSRVANRAAKPAAKKLPAKRGASGLKAGARKATPRSSGGRMK